MRHFGIIGHPLGHTLSPALHNWGFEAQGIDAQYSAWPTPPDQLAEFMQKFRKGRIAGLSITIPHKQAVIPMVDRLEKRAQDAGAVNTLWWDGDVLVGDNTDVAGIVHPVRKLGRTLRSALVLGAGGAARAAAAACRELGITDISVSNRTREKAERIADDFQTAVVDWNQKEQAKPDLLINTTPVGMSGNLQDLSPWDGPLRPDCMVFDLVYNPLETCMLREATEAGCETIQGIEMFLHQGLEQFRLWTGKELDPKAAKELLLNKLR